MKISRRVQLDLDDGMIEVMERLERHYGVPTHAGAIRRAMALADAILSIPSDGSRLCVKSADGTVKELLVL